MGRRPRPENRRASQPDAGDGSRACTGSAAPASASTIEDTRPTPTWRAGSWNSTRSIRAAKPRNANRIASICRSRGSAARRRPARRWKKRRTSALAAHGMGNAKALFVATTTRIMRTFTSSPRKSTRRPAAPTTSPAAGARLSVWAEQYEREHGGVVNHQPRRSTNELREAIAERDAERRARGDDAGSARPSPQGSSSAPCRKKFIAKRGATAGEKRSVELERAQFANAILTMPIVVHLRRRARRRRRPATRRAAVLEAEAACAAARPNGLAANTDARPQRRSSAPPCSTARGTTGSPASRRTRSAMCTGAEGPGADRRPGRHRQELHHGGVRDAYEAAGHRVIGLGPTNKVAQEHGRGRLRAMRRPSIANCSRSTTAARSWDAKTVVIVDEAAMLDTTLMAMVTAHAHDAGAKLILVGDDRQLSSSTAAACSAC